MFSKIVFAVVFGVYSVTIIENFSFVELIYKAFQICLLCLMGVSKMQKSKMFVNNGYRGRIVKKINNLEEFYSDCREDKGED